MSLSLPVVLAAALLSAAPSSARRVAVLDFNARWASKCGDANMSDAQEERCEALRLFADQARGGALAVLRPPAFVVMTRENTAQILKDMGGQCSEGECEVETARLLGASVVVSGEVSYMEGIWLVSIKVHDVATAALLGTGNTEGKSKLEAFRNVRAETQRMLKEAVGLDGVGAHAAAPPPIAAVAPKAEPPKQVEPVRPPPVVVKVEESAEAAPASREAATPSEALPTRPVKRWWVEAAIGGRAASPVSGISLSGSGATRSHSSPVAAALRGGYQFRPDWAVEVGLYSPMDANFGTAGVGNYSQTDVVRLPSVGVVWRPGASRYFSAAAGAGVAIVSMSVNADGTGSPVQGGSTGFWLYGALRAEYPLGSFSAGLQLGFDWARISGGKASHDPITLFDVRVDDGATITEVPISASVKYRF